MVENTVNIAEITVKYILYKETHMKQILQRVMKHFLTVYTHV